MLGIILGAVGMLFVYYTVQTIFGPVDEEFYLGYYTGIGATLEVKTMQAILLNLEMQQEIFLFSLIILPRKLKKLVLSLDCQRTSLKSLQRMD